MNEIIGIGGYTVSNQEGNTITTYALSSCVAVTVYCPAQKASGMIHVALPEPSERVKDTSRLGYYASTGIPLLFHKLNTEYGCENHSMIVQVYGGANSRREHDVFQVGKKNLKAIERIFMDMGIQYQLQEVGGCVSRSIHMEVMTGEIICDSLPMNI